MKVNCKCCNILFDKANSEIKKSPNHYCSQSCAAKINNSICKLKSRIICINCNNICKTRQCKKYCSSKCQSDFFQKEKINNWLLGKDLGYNSNGLVKPFLKRYLIQKSNYKCSECGWNKINNKLGRSPLEIHHIDGNWKNNKEENLKVLCPNCHALTDNYKALNKNGRKFRNPL